ncbi:hypothetical protein PV11_07699 [Exophiala sideris]|uniref:HIT-type domain-containing protein n=1 Tax=Exophiala sideris TaxID=1016849 RepID=A0A0D1VVB4_9EURO|nr:hypothetical protein PV11_07699 [Exophiala sideris]
MPLIEELPVTASNARPSHGWAYIPDTGASIPAVQLGSRKRGRDGTAATAQAAHKLSAKQEKAIQQRLNDLGKENFREANIPIPKREGGKGRDRKTTQNVRRILAYSRTFQHYLADEEAGVNVYGAAATAAAAAVPNQAQRTGDSKRRGAAAAASAPADQKPTPTPRQTKTSKKATRTSIKSEADVEMTDAPAPEPSAAAEAESSQPMPTTSGQEPSDQTQNQEQSEEPYDPALDKDPLLRTRDLPKMPSDRVMQALLAEPPLSYIAARAKPLEGSDSSTFAVRTGSNALVAKPQRWFCAVCGYWGKVRCKRGCGERVCGLLECWKAHEGVCSVAAY